MPLADKICDQYAPGINLPHDICENCGWMRKAHAPKKQAYESPITPEAIQLQDVMNSHLSHQIETIEARPDSNPNLAPAILEFAKAVLGDEFPTAQEMYGEDPLSLLAAVKDYLEFNGPREIHPEETLPCPGDGCPGCPKCKGPSGEGGVNDQSQGDPNAQG